MKSDPILVTGATGYVGGRLIPALLDAGYQVRAMGRSPGKMACRPWAGHSQVELVPGDVLDLASLKKASAGCRTAYYLVHSMIAQKEKFVEADRRAAHNMVAAATASGLERIIYLGGLAEAKDSTLSKHLQSRIEVADILQSGPVPTTDLRAPMILGSGSASFEILRYLVERLPAMITPRWVQSLNQPIAIRDVIAYLVGCLEHAATVGETFDIGGPDILTYRDLLDIYAEEAVLRKRFIIPVPVLTPTLSAYWIRFISPVPTSIALPLTEGLTSDAVCTENRIRSIMPRKLLSCREAIRLALDRLKQGQVDTCWMDAGELIEPEWAHCGDAEWAGGTIMNCGYRAQIKAGVEEVWQPVSKIGLRRGRRHPTDLMVGDALDFWRVLEVEPPRRLLLLAEMKTPGEALLEFQITPLGDNRAELQMLSRFLPRGLGGILYWYGLYPFHEWIFYGMLKSIAKSIGQPIVDGPQRFTPKLRTSCRLPQGKIPS